MNAPQRILKIARWHVAFGLVFAVLGMVLGIYMASSHNHTQHVTHAHILLLGFVVSVLYGVVYRLWLPAASAMLSTVQTGLHQAGTVGIVAGLFLLYGGFASDTALGPVLGVSSICALLGAALILYQFLRAPAARPILAGGNERLESEPRF